MKVKTFVVDVPQPREGVSCSDVVKEVFGSLDALVNQLGATKIIGVTDTLCPLEAFGEFERIARCVVYEE